MNTYHVIFENGSSGRYKSDSYSDLIVELAEAGIAQQTIVEIKRV